MIIDHISLADRYFALHESFEQAFEFISSFNENVIEAKKFPLVDSSLIAILEPIQGKGHSKAQLEAHRKYIDIQYVLEGVEEIGWKPYRECQSCTQEYNPEKDIEFFSDPPLVWLTLKAGNFAIFFPTDAHAPLAGSGPVKKIIMKVAFKELFALPKTNPS